MNTVARRGRGLLFSASSSSSSLSAASSSSSSSFTASSRVLSSLYSSSSSSSRSEFRSAFSVVEKKGLQRDRASSSSFTKSSSSTSSFARRGSNTRKWISTSATKSFSSEGGEEGAKPAAVDDDTVVVDLSKGENTTPPSSKILKLAEEIVKLNMLEINDLGNILQEKMGISDQQLYGMGGGSMGMGGGGGSGGNVAAGGGAAGGGDAQAPEAAQTEFSLKLDAFDASSKIKVIKEVRAATELGLKEAKDLVEGAPCVLKKGLSKADAEAMMAKIVAAGATCSLE